jgi:hypothetical protein
LLIIFCIAAGIFASYNADAAIPNATIPLADHEKAFVGVKNIWLSTYPDINFRSD